MPPSNFKATPEFKYPPVQADRSLTSLDLNTLMMKSTTRRLPEQPGSSLDDSTYEMLTDSLIETSDDEAHTESIASTSDAPTPDDASTFSDDEDDFETGERALNESIQSLHTGAADNDLDTPLVTGGEDSMLTAVPDHMEGSGGSHMIELDEEIADDAHVLRGSKIIKTLPDQADELPPVLERYGRTQIRLVVRAALSPRCIPTPESYKILYLGLPEKWVQDSITSHIHAALTTSPSNTRSVMVRGQMEPFGPVLHAYRCVRVQIYDDDASVPGIIIGMEDGRQLRIGHRKTPKFDLVVFCHTRQRDSSTDGQAFNPLRAAFRKHKIPTIDLSETRPYGAGIHAYDTQSLSACIEGRNDENADFELIEVLPLDAFTFCELEPSQINRHLASISPHLVSPEVDVAPKTRLSALGATLRAIGKQLHTGAPVITKVLLLSIALIAMLSAFALSTVYMPLVLQRSTEIAAGSPLSSAITISSPLITPAAVNSQSVAPVPSLSSYSSQSVPKGLTVVAPQVKQPKPKQEKKKSGDKPSGFDIQTAGDRQFVLTPSKDLASSRKKPQLQIQVFRNSTLIPVRYVRTISGEYYVDLEDEHPFGTFNISIASYSKPLLRQSFEVNLGHNKTWFDQTLDATTIKVLQVQSMFLNTSFVAVQQLQATLSSIASSKVGQWVEEGRQLEQAAYRNAKDGLGSGVEMLKHVPESTWMGLRRATAPVRLSQTMWKARMNALRLRCHLEKTAELWSKRTKEPESRACAQVQSHAQERKKI